MLGVTIRDNLSMRDHVKSVCECAAQSLYAIKLLKSHGLDKQSTADVCRSTVLSRLTYASPSWWGFTTQEEKQKLQGVLNRAIRWGYLDKNSPTINDLCSKRDTDLFNAVLNNTSHVLHHLLPPTKSHSYNLRARAHNHTLPKKNSPLVIKNFLPRMLYRLSALADTQSQ